MAKNSCGSPTTHRGEARAEQRRMPTPAGPALAALGGTGPSVDLNVQRLRERLGAFGNPEDQVVYAYIVDTVHPVGEAEVYEQRGSAPNWEGEHITLCTCKHPMRASLTPAQWMQDKWVVAMTGYNQRFGYQQSLICLFRVGEAHPSMAALAHALRQSGREAVAAAKDATVHPRGDLMMPLRAGIPANPHDPAVYREPCLQHVHRQPRDPECWHQDVNYVGGGGRQAPMLVGDPRLSFRWTRPMVRRRDGEGFRRHRVWTLTSLLDDLEAVA